MDERQRLRILTNQYLHIPMSASLHKLASIYRNSAAGKGNAQGNYFLIDYEKFLRKAKLADGDERELAEKELALAESRSKGLLSIDYHPKSHEPERIRLELSEGEKWLFDQVGESTPKQQRIHEAQFFEDASKHQDIPPQWAGSWTNYFKTVETHALNGQSILPFKRNDRSFNQGLLKALKGVLNWQEESLIRYASCIICGHSKRLAELEQPLLQILGDITGEPSLESFGILHKPRAVTFHGPLQLSIRGTTIDFSTLPGPVSLSETNLHQASALSCTATICLSIENQDVFHELTKRNPGILLILTSYPGSAVLKLFSILPSSLTYYHFGDSDPSGFDILRDLRGKTQLPIQPLLMDHHPCAPPTPLSPHDQKLLENLLTQASIEDCHPVLNNILQTNDKGLYEQEHIPIPLVLRELEIISKNLAIS